MTTRIAIAKGRIFDEAVPLLQRAGLDTSALEADSRSLIRPLADGLEAMIVRSQDVPLFVERAACTLGITGLDTLREQQPRLFELADLGIGRCRMSIAGPPDLDFAADPTRHWRVATKYPRLTAEAFEKAGRYYELVEIGGAMETAPESGIADCIVDLVETGRTLEAHGLVVYETILEVSSHLVANPTGFYRDRRTVADLLERLLPVTAGEARA